MALVVLIMTNSKLTFEDYLAYIEDELGIQLFAWQKEILRASCEGNLIYYPSRDMGKVNAWALKVLETAALDESLQKSIKRRKK